MKANELLSQKLLEFDPSISVDNIRHRLKEIMPVEHYEFVESAMCNYPGFIDYAVRYDQLLKRGNKKDCGLTKRDFARYAEQHHLLALPNVEKHVLRKLVAQWVDNNFKKNDTLTGEIWCMEINRAVRMLKCLFLEAEVLLRHTQIGAIIWKVVIYIRSNS